MRKYLRKLRESIQDEHNVFVELMLATLVVEFGLLIILIILGMIVSWTGG